MCEFVRNLIPPVEDHGTSYVGRLPGHGGHPGEEEIAVVLTGFIGRIDIYAKRRLGRELEGYMDHLNLPQFS